MVAMWQDRATLSVTRLLYGTQNLSVKRGKGKTDKREKTLDKAAWKFYYHNNIFECDEGKEYQKEAFDRELPVGERRERSFGNTSRSSKLKPFSKDAGVGFDGSPRYRTRVLMDTR